MIKVFLLIVMMHSPTMPYVKYKALFYPNLEQCEIGSVWQENITVERAMKDGLNPVVVKTKCLEMDMFISNPADFILFDQQSLHAQ